MLVDRIVALLQTRGYLRPSLLHSYIAKKIILRMALTYSLDLQTALPADVKREVLNLGLLTMSPDSSLTAPGVWAWIAAPSQIHRDIIHEAYLFESSVDVSFRLDSVENEDGERLGVISMLTIIFKVLDLFSGDAIFLFNGENPIFRRAGKLLVWDEKFPHLLEISKKRKLISVVDVGNIPVP